MSVALDTNLLAYAAGIDDEVRQRAALAVIRRINVEIVVPVQVLGEFYRVLVKRGVTASEAEAVVRGWDLKATIQPTTQTVFAAAMTLSQRYRLQIWDSVILAAAAAAGSRILLSEDMQDGALYGGVTVVNPLRERPHPLLGTVLAAASP